MNNTTGCVGAILAASLLIVTQSASAALVGSTGDITIVANPVSVAANVTESSTSIIAFEEKQGYTLSAELLVDELYGTGSAGSVSAGTTINSHFLHFDPVGTCGLNACLVDLSGSLTFGEQIIGLIWTGLSSGAAPVTDQLLDASDYLGAVGTYYETGALGRGFEIGEFWDVQNRSDIFTVSADGKSLSYVYTQASELRQDQFRVITVSQVPLPGALIYMLSSLCGLVFVKRRSSIK